MAADASRGGRRPRRPSRGEPPPDPQAEDDPPGDPQTVARAICLRLLDQRARSRGELATALRRRGVPDEAAAAVLDRLEQVGLIDDRAVAESMALAQHRERGLARRAVAAKLRTRGFEDDAIGAALEGIDTDGERERAAALVQRRLRALSGLPEPVQARRLVGMLARKGYPSGLAFEVVRAALGDLPDTHDEVG